jgi:endonuclease/exonuclease/phosphatase family metal-dependent hydrolase
MVTWTRFLDLRTDQQFYCFNTHIDHESPCAQDKSAHLIIERVKGLGTDHPVLLVGDFNALAERSRTFETLVGSQFFSDTWNIAQERVGEGLNTSHGFGSKIRWDDERIDWILIRGASQVQRCEIVQFEKEGQYPSDHFPVVAWLALKEFEQDISPHYKK